jgi:hypothetical protein
MAMDGPLGPMLLVAVSLAGGMVLAWGTVTFLTWAARVAGRRFSHARGTDRPAWAPGIWHCASCLTTNLPSARRCARCHRPRTELTHAPAEPRPDWIPERIAVPPGAIVTLVHDPAAHLDPGEAHWRITAGGLVVGSAARLAGALALLRALEGVDVVALDVRGTGPSAYRLADVIARFEAPRFPLDVDCPERTA